MRDEALLHRVIKPGWWLQAEAVSSQAFRPEPKDENQMSVYDGEQMAAEQSWRHYAGNPEKPDPIGVLSVTVGECSNQALPVNPDPDTFPAHVLVDFSQCNTNQTKKKSERLRDAAVNRGWQYRP